MDDWNRVRESIDIRCPFCKAEHEKRRVESAARERERHALHSRAKRLAQARYLGQWLSRYAGVSKKQAWLLYTGGNGYPALGTFYAHLKDTTIEKYMTDAFERDFEDALQKMGVSDREIQDLLASMARI